MRFPSIRNISFVFLTVILFVPISFRSPNQSVKADLAGIFNIEEDPGLQTKAAALLPLFDSMPPVPIFTTDEPILRAGTNTETGIAYTYCLGNKTPYMIVKKAFLNANRIQIINMLKHELTHAWLCRQSLMYGHDYRFHEKFEEVGGFGN
jgi:hypothetical protein